MSQLPRFFRIRRHTHPPRITDIPETVRSELDASGVHLEPGSRVALAVGSRGIMNLAAIVRETVDWLKQQGAQPFIVPAMGSHGGGTAEGQEAVLREYGVSQEALGIPVVSSMEVVELPGGDLPVPVFFDQKALEADATVILNRVKPHTSFHGAHESGLVKMVAIGLGKHRGAASIHRLGVTGLREIMPKVAAQGLRYGNVRLGIAIVENSNDETMLVKAVPAARIVELDHELLAVARAAMPALPVSAIDILILDEMGKDISGLGIDPNIVGRLKIPGQPEPESPKVKMIIVRALTAKSRGNAAGVGLADIITRNLFEAVDLRATYENVLTSTFLERAKIPLIAEDDDEALQFAGRATGVPALSEARILRVKNTLHLADAWISEVLLPDVSRLDNVEVRGEVSPVLNETRELTDL
ncbi:MAG: DUF362 domain-containing protein [Acidobacteria bacterium]|nr:MAG: DUF362 domain-containing protein [Acidobacteriota bacterium]